MILGTMWEGQNITSSRSVILSHSGVEKIETVAILVTLGLYLAEWRVTKTITTVLQVCCLSSLNLPTVSWVILWPTRLWSHWAVISMQRRDSENLISSTFRGKNKPKNQAATSKQNSTLRMESVHSFDISVFRNQTTRSYKPGRVSRR